MALELPLVGMESCKRDSVGKLHRSFKRKEFPILSISWIAMEGKMMDWSGTYRHIII